MRSGTVAAVDLGATSGRVVLGRVGPDELSMEVVHRFPNRPVSVADGLHWDILELYRNIVEGLGKAVRQAPDLLGVGIDSWAVDYALLHDGALLGAPYHYRDGRCAAGVESVHRLIDRPALYARNGLQFLPFNTLYQLTTEGPRLGWADSMLMIPDLVAYWLTGEQRVELTNASTTGLVQAGAAAWDAELLETLGIPSRILPELVAPGTPVGELTAEVAGALGASVPLRVIAVGAHDTASAVVAVPMGGEQESSGSAYVSCGTWGLVGVEQPAPILTDAAREAGFTNERGVDGRTRFLHNVMGLWLLSEALRDWETRGLETDLEELLREAADVPGPVAIFDADDPRFLPPGGMLTRIAEICREAGQPVPQTPPETVRAILESLAAAFARTVDRAEELTGRRLRVVHVVGGGARNQLLCQLTADRCGRPVLAGPVEATALGNILVQARQHGLVHGALEDLRTLVERTHDLERFEPRTSVVGSPR